MRPAEAGAVALLALLGATGAAQEPPAPPPPPQAPTFEGTLEVTEASVLVLPHRDVGAAGLAVHENGERRTVLRVEPLGGPDDPARWQTVIAVDDELCDDEAARPVLLELAFAAEEIAAHGPVTVLAGGERPPLQVRRGAGRLLAERAASLSGRPGCRRVGHELLWEARRAMATSRTPAATAQLFVDRITELADARASALLAALPPCEADLCALFLVHSGYPLDPLPWMAARSAAYASEVDTGRLKATANGLGSRLSEAGWVVFPASVWRSRSADSLGSFLNIVGKPGTAALGALAGATGGQPWLHEGALSQILRQLEAARLVWYRTEPYAPGEVREIAVTEVGTGDPVPSRRRVAARPSVAAPEEPHPPRSW